MEHHIKEQDGVTIVALEGDVDLQSSPEARQIFLECVAGNLPVLVDLSKVGYIDSSGVASLVESLQASRKAGRNFALASVSAAALKVLKLARLDKVFTIFDTLEDGIRGIAG